MRFPRPKSMTAAAVFGVAALGACWQAPADWRQFRGGNSGGGNSSGANSGGKADEPSLPLTWSEKENIAWTANLPGRGVSGPIVVGDRVVVTASSGYRRDRLHVLCFDDKTGGQLWQRQFWATGRTLCHPKMCVATPTPASDGMRIFASYSTNDVFCLDLDGNLQWLRGLTHDYPNAYNEVGMSSSPVVAGETLVLQVESLGDSFAVGLNVTDGEERWKVERPKLANWTSPVVLCRESARDELVLMQSGQGLVAYDPLTGEPLWRYDQGCSIIPSAAIAGDLIFLPTNGLTALRCPAGQGGPEVLWQTNRGDATPSPLYYRGQVFTMNGAGILECLDAASGESRWRLRLKGPFSGSPVAAAGYLYLFNEEGEAVVVEPGSDKGEIVGASQLGETVLCTPAIANGAIFVRSDRRLWKIAFPTDTEGNHAHRTP